MSKITFRADDDLVERLEALDASKSEAMRDALRAYLDGAERDDAGRDSAELGDAGSEDDANERSESDTVDDVIRERVDELVSDRLDELVGRSDYVERARPRGARDLNVNVTVDGVKTVRTDENTEDGERTSSAGRQTPSEDERKTRAEMEQPQAGAKPCDKCGERVDVDHVHCPNCGEKASHRVFCECGDELRSDWAFCPGCGRRTSAADVLERT